MLTLIPNQFEKNSFLKIGFTFYLVWLIALSIGIVFVPNGSIIFIIFLIYLTALFLSPKMLVVPFGVFLVLQSYLVSLLDRNTLFGSIVLQGDEIFLFVTFIILFLKKFSQESFRWAKTPIDIPLLGLISISAISTFISHIVPWKHSIFDFFILLKGFIIFYIFSFISFNEKDLKYYIKAFLIIALSILLLGLVDLAFGIKFKEALFRNAYIDMRGDILSVSSIYSHPGEFGWSMAYFACFVLAFFMVLKKNRYFIIFCLFLIGVLLSMRIKPISGLLISIFCGYLILRKDMISNGIKFVLILLIVGLFFGQELISIIRGMISNLILVRDPIKIARNALYLTSWKIAIENFPFGSGLGTFGGWIAFLFYSPLYYKYGLNNIYGLSQEGSYACDTFWPYIIGQLGIFGFIFYMWIIWKFIRLTYKGIKIFQSKLLIAFSLGTLLILIEALIESLASPIFLKVPSIYFIFGALGILNSLLIQEKTYHGDVH